MRTFLILFLFSCLTAAAQTRRGTVLDAVTHQPLAHAKVASGAAVAFTDIDGNFEIESASPHIIASAIGYASRDMFDLPLYDSHVYGLYLQPMADLEKRQELSRKRGDSLWVKVFNAATANNAENRFSHFKFHAYNKLLVTANPDSIAGTIDSVFYFKYKGQKLFRKMDSSDYHFKKYISRQHLFLSEKVSDFTYDGSTMKETISGARMGGFPQPVYEIIALRLQSFSVYSDEFELMQSVYNGFLAGDARNYYTFSLIGESELNARKVLALAFEPKRKKGISGILLVDAGTLGIAAARIRFRGVLDISARYDFRFLAESELWFPSFVELRIAKGRYDRPISILGTTLDFEPESGTANQLAGRAVGPQRRKFASDYIYAASSSWFSSPDTVQPVRIRHRYVEAEITDDAIHRDEAFWQPYRKFEPDVRDEQSYKSLDSISGKAGLQWKLQLLRRVIYGYIPLGPVDLRFTDILAYNDYEGLRVGIGGVTNERFSKKYRLDGYVAYGLRDTRFKYSMGGALRLGKYSNSWLGVAFTDDLREIASTTFATDPRKIRIYDGRPFNITTFYSLRSWRGYIESRLIPKTESIWQLELADIDPLFDYVFLHDGRSLRKYTLATGSVSLQWNPYSSYMQTPMGRMETQRGYPKFSLQYTQAVAGIFKSDLSFGKLDFRAEYEKTFLGGQKTTALALAGWAYGDVPITQLYNSTPNNPRQGNVLERIRPWGRNGFETMLFNEFFSSRYFMLQWRGTSQRFEISRSIKPSFGVVSRMAYGDVGRPEQHFGLDFKMLDKGYFESGVEVNAIYSGLGIGGYYRYGANSLPQTGDNFSIKVSYVLEL